MQIKYQKNNKGFTRIVDFRLTKMWNIFAGRKSRFSPSRKFTTGFTLIEIMVATTIFVFVVMISMGAIFTIVDANKKAQSLESVMNNLNFALETMTRTIKTGQIISVSSDESIINVVDQRGHDMFYTYTGNKITVKDGNGSVMDITAPEVNITKMKFVGIHVGGGGQPMVFIIVQGEVAISQKIKSNFNIQTTVTQRLLKN